MYLKPTPPLSKEGTEEVLEQIRNPQCTAEQKEQARRVKVLSKKLKANQLAKKRKPAMASA